MPMPRTRSFRNTRLRILPLAPACAVGLLVFGPAPIDAHAQTPTAERGARTREGADAALKPGDNGPAVEDLQRRLNAALSPSPALDVDGDFGDGTRAAVVRFQRSKGLAPSGTADAATRRALADVKPPAEPEVPAPDVVNAQMPAKKPADSLDGPPFVSAKAWAIADGRTGEVLWGDHQADQLPIASTTKMMTALVVARIIEQDPKALREIVTFSERADRTPGSTSAVRAGERVPVEELLYGMMLPSGNDATVAFAEHFGGRLKPVDGKPEGGDPLARFIAEMNRLGQELGLREARFTNTSGLPDPEHHASAGELARLARAVLEQPLLARVVSTPKRGYTLEDGAGNKRNIVWSNTNRLLGTEGYDGVKTGTTNAAGNCLVASGRRGDDRLIVVVLGAPTTDGRYMDAKNLFRWAWLRRGHAVSKTAAEPAGR